ncbi:MAG: hypothetical protein KGH62_02055, partial [Candidatus Micrarchaeota archaeon]|nr:hypothetical protein [Candidatus Micrarchaeota archaeon]
MIKVGFIAFMILLLAAMAEAASPQLQIIISPSVDPVTHVINGYVITHVGISQMLISSSTLNYSANISIIVNGLPTNVPLAGNTIAFLAANYMVNSNSSSYNLSAPYLPTGNVIISPSFLSQNGIITGQGGQPAFKWFVKPMPVIQISNILGFGQTSYQLKNGSVNISVKFNSTVPAWNIYKVINASYGNDVVIHNGTFNATFIIRKVHTNCSANVTPSFTTNFLLDNATTGCHIYVAKMQPLNLNWTVYPDQNRSNSTMGI